MVWEFFSWKAANYAAVLEWFDNKNAGMFVDEAAETTV